MSDMYGYPDTSKGLERILLGGLMKWPAMLDCLHGMTVDDLRHWHHRAIFQAIVDLNQKDRQEIDLPMLADLIYKRGQVEDIGGYVYLWDCWESSGAGGDVPALAVVLRETSRLRRLRESLEDAKQCAETGSMTVDQVAEQIVKQSKEMAAKDDNVPLLFLRDYVKMGEKFT